MNQPPAPLRVEVTDLTLRYGKTTALDRLSLSLPAGRIYGLIGRNGSGKTSLLSLLAAFRRPTAGRVRVEGEDPFENEPLTRRICLIRESGDVFESERCDRVLALAGALRPHWDQALAERLVERFDLPLRKLPIQLSRGQRSALGCVLGLASRAPLTIFDESYLGMDVPSRYAFYEELVADYAEHPRTIILSTHLVAEFGSLFEDVIILDRGRLVVHEPADALRARGTSVVGPAETVDRFLADLTVQRSLADLTVQRSLADLTVLGERSLGATKAATVFGPLSAEQRAAAGAAGLRLEPVPLQDLFVHLLDSPAAGGHLLDNPAAGGHLLDNPAEGGLR